MKYEDIRDQLKTGDILLFSGKGGISDGIKFFTRSQYSHVGMVYRLDDPLDPNGTVFCWESTTLSDLADADTGKLTKGVQRVELSERLERCFAKGYAIRVRPLTKALTDTMVESLNAFRHEVSDLTRKECSTCCGRPTTASSARTRRTSARSFQRTRGRGLSAYGLAAR